MSEMSKKARAAMRAKASRMAGGDPHKKVDASSWKPSEPQNGNAQTGARPIRARIYKAGGRVQGDRGPRRADKAPRQATESANAKINRNVVNANAEFGKPHIGGFKKGGKARHKRDMGGMTDPRETAQGALSAAGARSGAPPARMGSVPGKSDFARFAGIKKGGAVKRATGGRASMGGTRPEGGRIPKKEGGRAKGRTNINIIIGSQKPQPDMNAMAQPGPVRPPPMPVPVPPAGGPPAGMPMPMGGPPGGGPPPGLAGRKEGGRVKHTARSTEALTAGAGGGLGRLQKADLQEHSRR